MGRQLTFFCRSLLFPLPHDPISSTGARRYCWRRPERIRMEKMERRRLQVIPSFSLLPFSPPIPLLFRLWGSESMLDFISRGQGRRHRHVDRSRLRQTSSCGRSHLIFHFPSFSPFPSSPLPPPSLRIPSLASAGAKLAWLRVCPS